MALRGDRLRFALPTLILLVATSLRAWAAPPVEPAQQLFDQGVEAARQDRWNDARGAFERAYALSPRSVVLINLAGAQANTGRLTEAAANYRRILADESRDTAPFRSAAAGVLPALEARIPRIRLHGVGVRPDDLVEVDGHAVPFDSREAPQLVDPGAHTITVARAGQQRARVTVSVSEGESHDVSLMVSPEAPAMAGAAPGLELTASDAPPPQPQRSWWRSPWLWTAVAAVAVGGVATALALRGGDQDFSGNIPPGLIHVP